MALYPKIWQCDFASKFRHVGLSLKSGGSAKGAVTEIFTVQPVRARGVFGTGPNPDKCGSHFASILPRRALSKLARPVFDDGDADVDGIEVGADCLEHEKFRSVVRDGVAAKS